MKNLFLVLVVLMTGCNNVIDEEGKNETQDSLIHDTVSNENKLNEIINQNQESGDSMKNNVEILEQDLKNKPKE